MALYLFNLIKSRWVWARSASQPSAPAPWSHLCMAWAKQINRINSDECRRPTGRSDHHHHRFDQINFPTNFDWLKSIESWHETSRASAPSPTTNWLCTELSEWTSMGNLTRAHIDTFPFITLVRLPLNCTLTVVQLTTEQLNSLKWINSSITETALINYILCTQETKLLLRCQLCHNLSLCN